MKKLKLIIPALAGAAILGCGVAQAASPQTGNLQVKIEITQDCQVNTGTDGAGAGDAILDFGSHGVLNAKVDGETASTGAGSIQVQCTNGTDYDIGLDGGQNKDVNARQMKGGSNGTEFVGYQLYSDAARQTVWGDTVGTDTVRKQADGTVQTYPVYGEVPAQTTPSAGTYADTVAINVTF